MIITTKEELVGYLRSEKERLHRDFGVTKLGFFGSFARDKQSPTSDIDIVIEMQGSSKSLRNFLELKRYLEKQTKRKVDLGFVHTLKPIIKEHIEKQIVYI